MRTVFETIKDWPVIVQGALGSALFALVMYVGQLLFSFVPRAVSKLSAGRRKQYLKNRYLRFKAKSSKDLLSQSYYASMLWFRASRDLLKALIWLTLGLLFTNFLGVWGVIGYLGCLYYLFFALEVVKPVKESGDELAQMLQSAESDFKQFVVKSDA